MKKKKIMIIISILVLIGMLGISYAFFVYNSGDTNSHVLIAGSVYLEETNQGNAILQEMYPMTDEEGIANGVKYQFNIKGHNESMKDLYYGIYINQGDEISGKTRFKDNEVRLYLTERIDGVTRAVYGPGSLQDFNNRLIYANLINAQTNIVDEVSIDYELTMWLDERILISDSNSEIPGRIVYTTEVFKNSYVSIRPKIYGDFSSRNVNLEISATGTLKTSGTSYIINKNYDDTDYTDENVVVKLSAPKEVSKFIITNAVTKEVVEKTPTLVGGNYQVTIEYTTSGSYTYYGAYLDGTTSSIGSYNIKIDKNIPSFTIENGTSVSVSDIKSTYRIENRVTNISDDNNYKVQYALVGKDDTPSKYTEVTGSDSYTVVINAYSGLWDLVVKVIDETGRESVKRTTYTISYPLTIDLNNQDGVTIARTTHRVVAGQKYNYIESLPSISDESFTGYATDAHGNNMITNDSIVGNDVTRIFTIFVDLGKITCTMDGPSTSMIKKDGTATYTLMCTDSIAFDDTTISSSDFTLSTSGVVTVGTPSKASVTNGYQWTITVTGASQGSTTLTLKSGVISDTGGNTNDSVTSASINVDATPPTFEFTLSNGGICATVNESTVYCHEAQNITVTATDLGGSGFKNMRVHVYKNGTFVASKSIDSTDSSTFVVPVDTAGNWGIFAYAYDNAGNKSNQTPDNGSGYYYQNYNIGASSDTIKPTVEFSPSEGTYGTGQIVKVTPHDNESGISSYSILIQDSSGTNVANIENITTPSYSYQFNTPGTYHFYIRAFDNAGNMCEVRSGNEYWYYQVYTIINDTTPPTVTYTPASGDYPINQKVTVNFADNLGLKNYEVAVYYSETETYPNDANGSRYATYTDDISGTSATLPITMDKLGYWRFSTQVYDMSGNKVNEPSSDWQSSGVYHVNTLKDSTPPTVTYTPASGNYSINQKVTINFADNIGLKNYEVAVYYSATETYPSDANGSKYATYKKDISGTSATLSVTMDKNGYWRFSTQVYDTSGNRVNEPSADWQSSGVYNITSCTAYTKTLLASDTSSCTVSGTPGVDNTYYTRENARTRYNYTRNIRGCYSQTGTTTNTSLYIYGSSSEAYNACDNWSCSGSYSSTHHCTTDSRVLYDCYQYTRTCS